MGVVVTTLMGDEENRRGVVKSYGAGIQV